jgi:arylsulfatase A-like enzyme
MTCRILKSLAVLIGAFVAIYVGFVYPNDARLSFPLREGLKLVGPQVGEPQKLRGAWPPFKFSLNPEEYEIRVQAAAKVTTHYLGENLGVASPYIWIHSIGDYPDRLEGTQVMVIPAGENVEFSPGVEGKFRLEFKSTAIAGSPTLIVDSNSRSLLTMPLKEPPPQGDLTANAYLYFWKYFSVDRTHNRTVWNKLVSHTDLAEGDSLVFRCQGNGGFCLVSRPTLYTPNANPKPNYLVILVDTLRASAINGADAPNMERIRNRGSSFESTFAAGNLTSQSTNSFLSCQKPTDIGSLAFSYNMPALAKKRFYARGEPSFPHFFKRAGWKTTMIGNVSVISEVMGAGIDHGFEDQIAIEREAYDTKKIAGEAIDWLSENGDKQFFLYLHFHATHAPYRPPLRDIANAFRGVDDLKSMPALLRWLYRGEVSYTDRYVQEVIEALDQLGLKDNTRIVLTADHGDQQEIRTFADNKAGSAETGAFFDHGATLLNDEIHVPLVFAGFDGFQPGTKNYDLASNLDIGPTLLQDAGIPIPDWCDGTSLNPANSDRSAAAVASRVMGSEGIRQRAVYFDNRYKFTVSYSTTEKNLFRNGSYSREMYSLFDQDLLIDLKADPREEHNLAGENPVLLDRAKQIFDQYFRTGYLWELVLESPPGDEMIAEMGPRDKPVKFEGLGFRDMGDKVQVYMVANQRGIAYFDRPLASPPEVRSGESRVPVLNTTARLDLNSMDLGLPVENIGVEALLPVGSKKTAYIIKVARTDFQARKIVAGNPQFEAILREWGYLNDN